MAREEDLRRAVLVAFWVRCFLTEDKASSSEVALCCLESGCLNAAELLFAGGVTLGFWSAADSGDIGAQMKVVCASILGLMDSMHLNGLLRDLELAETPDQLVEICTSVILAVERAGGAEFGKILRFLPRESSGVSFQASLAVDVPPLPDARPREFERSSSCRVFLHAPLLGLICEFVNCPALDATCKEFQTVRKSMVTYNLTEKASARYIANPLFREAILRRCTKLALWLQTANQVKALLTLEESPIARLSLRMDSQSYPEIWWRASWPLVEQMTYSGLMDVQERFCERFPNLKHLNLQIPGMDLPSLACIDKLKHLESFRLSVRRVDAPFHGADLPNLRRVSVDMLRAPLTTLGVFPGVTEFEITYHWVPLQGDELTRTFPQLTCLIDRCDSLSLDFLAGCKFLKELHINVSALSSIPSDLPIQKLGLRGNRVLAPQFEALGKMKHLQELVLSFSHKILTMDAVFVRSATVTTLDLTDVICTTLSFIMSFPKLQSLRIAKLRICDVAELNQCTWLRSVTVKERPPDELKRRCKVPVYLL